MAAWRDGVLITRVAVALRKIGEAWREDGSGREAGDVTTYPGAEHTCDVRQLTMTGRVVRALPCRQRVGQDLPAHRAIPLVVTPIVAALIASPTPVPPPTELVIVSGALTTALDEAVDSDGDGVLHTHSGTAPSCG